MMDDKDIIEELLNSKKRSSAAIDGLMGLELRDEMHDHIFNPISYDFEKTIEAYVKCVLDMNLSAVVAIHEWLVKDGLNEENPFVWNDLDNRAYYLPTNGYGIVGAFCLESQSLDYLFILHTPFLGEGSEPAYFTVCKYYRDLNEYMEDNSDSDLDMLKDMRGMVKRANWLMEFSDSGCRDGGLADFCYRPDLKWYKDNALNDDTHGSQSYMYSRGDWVIAISETGMAMQHPGPPIGSMLDVKYSMFYLACLYDEAICCDGIKTKNDT